MNESEFKSVSHILLESIRKTVPFAACTGNMVGTEYYFLESERAEYPTCLQCMHEIMAVDWLSDRKVMGFSCATKR